jgi:hypothetical protein
MQIGLPSNVIKDEHLNTEKPARTKKFIVEIEVPYLTKLCELESLVKKVLESSEEPTLNGLEVLQVYNDN